MNNPYNHPGYEHPTEAEAREQELAFILWQFAAEGNAKRAERLRKENDPYRGIDKLRAKLTSWPAMLFKRYEVARALALGWWHQLTLKEQRCIVDGAVTAAICVVVIVVFGWLAGG